MSGDVQPRKRKDKKKKREEDDLKESHHGVHAAKLGTDDVLLHVQAEHATGGHWCAKILFFSLLAILVGLIGLIIMENRGLADLDTPLSESRYSEYFEGWVDEHRQTHDERDKVAAELEDHDAEPFEEEEDHSEQDEGDGGEHDPEDHEDEHDQHHDGDEEEDDEEKTSDKEEEDDDKEQDNEDDEEKIEEEIEAKLYSRNQRDVENDDDKDDDNENVEKDDDNDDKNEIDEGIGDEVDDDDESDPKHNQPEISKYDFQNENDPFDEIKKVKNSENEITPSVLKRQVDKLYEKADRIEKSINELRAKRLLDQNVKKPKVDDDANDESLEEVIENDAEELAHLERKAKEQEENDNDDKQNDEEGDYSSSQIKSRTGTGGPQSFYDDDLIDEQLRHAEEERRQNKLKSSLKIYESIILKYPDNPGALYGKAKVLDSLSEKYQSNHILNEAIEAYKRFLATVEDKPFAISNQTFKEAAERCIDRMRFKVEFRITPSGSSHS